METRVSPTQKNKSKVALPEDLIYFHEYLDRPDAQLRKLNEPLVMYRHHQNKEHLNRSALTPLRILVQYRLRALERRVLSKWESFYIWGNGRDGRMFLRELSKQYRNKIKGFIDIDEKKSQKMYETILDGDDENSLDRVSYKVIHINELIQNNQASIESTFLNTEQDQENSKVKQDDVRIICCVALDKELRQNISKLNLIEGLHYVHFS